MCKCHCTWVRTTLRVIFFLLQHFTLNHSHLLKNAEILILEQKKKFFFLQAMLNKKMSFFMISFKLGDLEHGYFAKKKNSLPHRDSNSRSTITLAYKAATLTTVPIWHIRMTICIEIVNNLICLIIKKHPKGCFLLLLSIFFFSYYSHNSKIWVRDVWEKTIRGRALKFLQNVDLIRTHVW